MIRVSLFSKWTFVTSFRGQSGARLSCRTSHIRGYVWGSGTSWAEAQGWVSLGMPEKPTRHIIEPMRPVRMNSKPFEIDLCFHKFEVEDSKESCEGVQMISPNVKNQAKKGASGPHPSFCTISCNKALCKKFLQKFNYENACSRRPQKPHLRDPEQATNASPQGDDNRVYWKESASSLLLWA